MCSPPPTCTERGSVSAAYLIVAGRLPTGKGQKMDWDKLLRDSPDDTLLRLAYADWLEEHGEDDKARAHREVVRRGWKPADCTEAHRTIPQSNWPDAYVFYLRPKSWISTTLCGWAELARKRKQLTPALLPKKLFQVWARLAKPFDPEQNEYQPEDEAFGVKDKWRAYEILVEALVQLQ